MLGQGLPPPHDVKAGALLGAGLRQEKDAAREVERGERRPSGHPRTRPLPMQAARDHQVQHEKEVVVQLEDDPLAEARDRPNRLSLDGGDRRVEGPEEEGARDPRGEERLSDDAGLERDEVRGNVGQLRHADEPSSTRAGRNRQTARRAVP